MKTRNDFIVVTDSWENKRRINVNYIVAYYQNGNGTIINVHGISGGLYCKETVKEIDSLIEGTIYDPDDRI